MPSEPLIVDARGMRCPWPVLRAARVMRIHDQLVLLADDPIARTEIPDMARARGWECTWADDRDATRFFLDRRQK